LGAKPTRRKTFLRCSCLNSSNGSKLCLTVPCRSRGCCGMIACQIQKRAGSDQYQPMSWFTKCHFHMLTQTNVTFHQCTKRTIRLRSVISPTLAMSTPSTIIVPPAAGKRKHAGKHAKISRPRHAYKQKISFDVLAIGSWGWTCGMMGAMDVVCEMHAPSQSRNNSTRRLLLPAPVRPMTPVCSRPPKWSDTLRRAGGKPGR
jgi:hypothetical protein